MYCFTFWAVISASCLLAASAPSSTHVLHERRYAPLDTTENARVDGDAIITFRIGLKQTNLQHGEAYLMNISHPASPHYGTHWTAEKVHEAFAPSRESIDATRSWLAAAGIEEASYRNGWISFRTRIRQAEELLQAKYYEHKSARGVVRIGCDEYSLPRHISQHVDYLSPGVAHSSPLRKRTASTRRTSPEHQSLSWWIHNTLENSVSHNRQKDNNSLPVDLQHCGQATTPACIRALYDVPSPAMVARDFSGNSSTTLGVFEALNYYNQSDLDQYFATFAQHVPAGTHPSLQSVEEAQVNESAPAQLRIESNADLDILYALTCPKNITLYQVDAEAGYQQATADDSLFIGISNLLAALDGSFCSEADTAHGIDCGTSSLSTVTSISYDTGELYYPEKHQHRLCNEFMKLALQGHTFVVASGDWGVASDWNDDTLTNGCAVSGNYTASLSNTENGTIFHPQFPANCPYVLSVGGTMLNENSTVRDAESAMHQPLAEAELYAEEGLAQLYPTTTSSSGGFSNYFCRPSYQDMALDKYFTHYDPAYPSYTFNDIDAKEAETSLGADGGLYNRAGRGIPDVSANGANFVTFAAGIKGPVWGTSLATPIWASVLTLINDRRHMVGKGPVGFVNPVLYEHPEVFKDIVDGNNPGCGTKGFSAVPGWDPVTGLGTPNFLKLLELFLSLP